MRLYTLLFLFLMIMCEKDDGLTPCTTEPSPIDKACLEIYDPVCGCDGVTYSNACFAEISGVLRWIQGVCED